jgi:dihydropteroate synthase
MHSAEHCSYIHGVCQTVAEELAAAVDFAVSSGMNRKNILLDPGFGFSKTPEQCWEMAKNLTAIAAPEQMLAGVSRKKFLGWLTGETTPAARGGETLALELHLAACNIAVIRTHDVKSLYSALLVQQKLQGA